MDLQALAKLLVTVGAIIVLVGVGLYAASLLNLPLGRLPGDIRIERPGFRLYFPLMTSIVVSVLLSLALYLFSRLR